jgi:hypothetical protein
MGYGKGCAQAAHAANQLSDTYVIHPLLTGNNPHPSVMEWRSEARGFGTTITLDCPSMGLLIETVDAARELQQVAGVVTDDTYPYVVDREVFGLLREDIHTLPPVFKGDTVICHRKEATCGYIFGRKSKVSILTDRFKLLPNEPVR